jgi:hypothetical protein
MKRAVHRLPPELVERLEQFHAQVLAANPGRSCSRASLVRALVAKGLDVVEHGGADTFDELTRRAIGGMKKKRRGARAVRGDAELPPLEAPETQATDGGPVA